MSDRVIFFGLDGATFTILDDLVRRGVMPFFGEFRRKSAGGTLTSLEPPLTPIAWTSIVTGRTPGHHGILNFLQYESDDTRFVRLVTSRQICCETIWSIVSRQLGRAGSLNFVAHNPGFKIDGYVIPGWVPWRWMKKQSHPEGIVDQLSRKIPGFDVKELAMNYEEEEKAIAGAALEDYEPWIELHIRRERQWFEILRYQMKHEPCALTGIVFDGVDKLQHLLWQFLDPSLEPQHPTPEFERIRGRCWDYFREVDRFLEETVASAGPNAHILVASDHGFTGTTEILYINNWLESEGFLTWANDTPVQDENSHELGAASPANFRAFDLTKTRAFAATASNNGIHIPVAGVRGEHGIRASDYEKFRQELMEALLTRCVDPQTRRPIVTSVWTREEIFPGPKMHLAPDLTVALHDRGNFSVLRGGTIHKHRPVPLGCHHPDGIFLVHGPGVRIGANLSPLRLIDVAPTILYALGLPVPEDFEGRVAEEAFTADVVGSNPVEIGPPTKRPAHLRDIPDEVESDEESDAQVMMRLKALGYIE